MSEKGHRYRVEDLSRPERAAHVASRLKPRLLSASPARLKPHLRWSKLERRVRLAAALRRAELLVGRADFVKLKPGDDASAGEGSRQLRRS